MKRDLQAFLQHARGRITPEEVGLPRGPRRRVPGLRRDEVAELAGISVVWYVRGESGTARLSLAALNRISDVLRLSPEERSRLFVLARPELATASLARATDTFSGAGQTLVDCRKALRHLHDASSRQEVLDVLSEAVFSCVEDECLAYVLEPLDNGSARFAAATGAGSDWLRHHVQPSDAIDHIEPLLSRGLFVCEPDLRRSPSAELRARVEILGTLSYVAMPIMAAEGRWAYGLGYAMPVARAPRDIERAIVELLAGAGELALRNAS